ncbi:MAG: YggT family protein [Candidatus Accumulibacter sp.]|uniref:YggT family protein n=1 Tax=Accumulibacter sp. TaxID=2053492 RepID=UPI00287AB29C|nr:YggT family protein [Accumulibacter sp.]MDS4012770.1 YggT family protein [Accumulibacter sp.]
MIVQALLFLLDALVSFFSFALLLRFFMQAFRVSFSNRLGTFVVELTNWLVRPLRKLLPGFWGLDLASLLPALLLQIAFAFVLLSLRSPWPLSTGADLLLFALWRGVLATVRLSLYLFIGALLVQAVLSWVSPYSPLSQPLTQFTRPIVRPIQRLVPPIGAVDLSPLIAIVLAQLILIFI